MSTEAPDTTYESDFLYAHEALASAGFEHYEVSNYGLPGHHARHNSAYWRGVPYLGLGPSAHGFDGAERRWNVSAYAAWQREVDEGRDPRGGAEQLTADNREAEAVYLGLRTSHGLPLRDAERDVVRPWEAADWATVSADGVLRCTPMGWLRLDALAAGLTTHPKSLVALRLMAFAELSDRERQVLEAVIQSYVATAEPAGSRVLSRRFGLGVSPATIRNTMSDLEEKGFLFHPHTSAGRVPTDKAYRVYVDSLMRIESITRARARRLAEQLAAGGSAIETILRRAAQTLGVLTQELGVALGPRLDRQCCSASNWCACRRSGCCWCSRSAAARCARSSSRCPARSPTRRWSRSRSCSTSDSAASRSTRCARRWRARLRDVPALGQRGGAAEHLRAGRRAAVRRAPSSRGDRRARPGVAAGRPAGVRERRTHAAADRAHGTAPAARDAAAGTRPASGLSITIGNEHGDPRSMRSPSSPPSITRARCPA